MCVCVCARARGVVSVRGVVQLLKKISSVVIDDGLIIRYVMVDE